MKNTRIKCSISKCFELDSKKYKELIFKMMSFRREKKKERKNSEQNYILAKGMNVQRRSRNA